MAPAAFLLGGLTMSLRKSNGPSLFVIERIDYDLKEKGL